MQGKKDLEVIQPIITKVGSKNYFSFEKIRKKSFKIKIKILNLDLT